MPYLSQRNAHLAYENVLSLLCQQQTTGHGFEVNSVPFNTCINKNRSDEEDIADDDEGKCTKTKSERKYDGNRVFEKLETHIICKNKDCSKP